MSKKQPKKPTKDALRKEENIKREIGDGVLGAIAGATVGSFAGPPGAAVGAVVGAAVGALAGVADARGRTLTADEQIALDETIGVTRSRV